jgi:hypothetical protein
MNNTPIFTGASTPTASSRSAASLMAGLPFDLARSNYARAVRFGFFQNSLLQSARFERELVQAERLTLGPWARQV